MEKIISEQEVKNSTYPGKMDKMYTLFWSAEVAKYRILSPTLDYSRWYHGNDGLKLILFPQ